VTLPEKKGKIKGLVEPMWTAKRGCEGTHWGKLRFQEKNWARVEGRDAGGGGGIGRTCPCKILRKDRQGALGKVFEEDLERKSWTGLRKMNDTKPPRRLFPKKRTYPRGRGELWTEKKLTNRPVTKSKKHTPCLLGTSREGTCDKFRAYLGLEETKKAPLPGSQEVSSYPQRSGEAPTTTGRAVRGGEKKRLKKNVSSTRCQKVKEKDQEGQSQKRTGRKDVEKREGENSRYRKGKTSKNWEICSGRLNHDQRKTKKRSARRGVKKRTKPGVLLPDEKGREMVALNPQETKGVRERRQEWQDVKQGAEKGKSREGVEDLTYRSLTSGWIVTWREKKGLEKEVEEKEAKGRHRNANGGDNDAEVGGIPSITSSPVGKKSN